jgi:hypothetical protein
MIFADKSKTDYVIRIVGTDAGAVPELVRLLHEEAKVI